jgi:hypothetical protein
MLSPVATNNFFEPALEHKLSFVVANLPASTRKIAHFNAFISIEQVTNTRSEK